MWVRTAAASVLALVMGLGCDDNPVDEGRDSARSLKLNPSIVVISAAGSTSVDAVAVNEFGDPTLTAVSFTSCDESIVRVNPDQTRVRIEPPDRAQLVAGTTLATSCVVATAAGLADTAQVNVVPARLVVLSAPDVLRAGETGEVVIGAEDMNGDPVGPFERTDVSYLTDADTVVVLTDDPGGVEALGLAGLNASITAQFSRAGATRSVSHTIGVVPNVPASAEVEASSFGSLAVGQSATLEVLVKDAFGNQNTVDAEIVYITAASSDLAVADVVAERLTSSPVTLRLTATAEGPGTATITGSVETSEGTFDFGSADVAVITAAPSVAGVAPGSGAHAATATISGSAFSETGFVTRVLVDGKALANFQVVSPTGISAQMPTFGTSGARGVVVELGGVSSSEDIRWTQTAGFDAEASEPDNDGDAPPLISVPFEFGGFFERGDVDDFFEFSVSEDVTIDILLDWTSEGLVHHSANTPVKDLDFLVFDASFDAADGSFDGVGCEGFFSKPETGEGPGCSLTPGTYFLLVEDFDAFLGDFAPVSYTITGVVR